MRTKIIANLLWKVFLNRQTPPSGFPSHFVDVENETRVDIAAFEKKTRAGACDPLGHKTAVVVHDYMRVGILSWITRRDSVEFSRCVTRAAELLLSMHERYSNGEPISPGYVSATSIRDMFDVLSLSSNYEKVLRITALLENNSGETLARNGATELELLWLRATVSVLLAQRDASTHVRVFLSYCEQNALELMASIAKGLQCIENADTKLFEPALVDIVSAYGREYKDSVDDPRSYVCLPGLALKSIMRMRGYSVMYACELVPRELSIGE